MILVLPYGNPPVRIRFQEDGIRFLDSWCEIVL